MDDRTFLVLPLSPTEQVRVMVQTWNGQPVVQVRRWWRAPGAEGSFNPTRRGVMVMASDVREFTEAVVAAAEEVLYRLEVGGEVDR